MSSLRRGPASFGLAAALAMLLAVPQALGAVPAKQSHPAAPAAPALMDQSRIAAVVNGDVISNADINNRARLFAISTGLPLSPDVLARLRPQILRQLIDERLRLQETEKRRIVIPDAQIAAAIKQIEARNNLPPGALRAKLAAAGVSPLTLIDQIRAQLAWTQLLRDLAGQRIVITPAEIAQQEKLAEQRTGQTEYQVAEIFIPINKPADAGSAERFAETVITELHAGAPFPMVAAQFSQSQSALQGGELGWVTPNQLDPQVAQVVTEMPVGAISNPIQVPGGLSIIALQAKRQLGDQIVTMLTLRQAFIPFSTPLTDPQNPTAQQIAALKQARALGQTIKSCDQMEAWAKAHNPANRPIDPGPVQLAAVNPPAFRQLLSTIPVGKPTEPLISRDGISVITVCSRGQKNVGAISKEEIRNMLINERVDMLSQQLMRTIRRQAHIDIREHDGA